MMNLTLSIMNCMILLNPCMMSKKLGSKYSTLKKNHAYLFIEKETLENKAFNVIDDCNKMNLLKEENKALKENVDKLNTTLAKFTKGSKISKIIIASQRCVFNKIKV